MVRNMIVLYSGHLHRCMGLSMLHLHHNIHRRRPWQKSSVRLDKRIMAQEVSLLAFIVDKVMLIEETKMATIELMIGQSVRKILPAIPSGMTAAVTPKEDTTKSDALMKSEGLNTSNVAAVHWLATLIHLLGVLGGCCACGTLLCGLRVMLDGCNDGIGAASTCHVELIQDKYLNTHKLYYNYL